MRSVKATHSFEIGLEGKMFNNNHEERMEKIENFFNNHSSTEIEELLIKSGAGVIRDSKESDYVKAVKFINRNNVN